MSLTPIFRGTVSASGKLELVEAQRTLLRQYLQTLAGHPVEWTIRRPRSQRSADQNEYLHAVPFLLLSNHWGTTIAETKLIVLGECWGWKYEPHTQRSIPIKAHTSELTVEEGSYLIEWLPPWALLEHSVEIPLPEKVDYQARRRVRSPSRSRRRSGASGPPASATRSSEP